MCSWITFGSSIQLYFAKKLAFMNMFNFGTNPTEKREVSLSSQAELDIIAYLIFINVMSIHIKLLKRW